MRDIYMAAHLLLLVVCKVESIEEQPPASSLIIRNQSLTPLDYLRHSTKHVRTEGRVFHMEPDLRIVGNLLFSDLHSLKSSDHNTTTLIAGSTEEMGHAVGPALDARYQSITGFVQLDSDHVVAVSWGHSCLHLIDRANATSIQFSGVCGNPGYTDGTVEAKFKNPVGIIKNINNASEIIIGDTGNNALRLLDIETRNVTTLFHDAVMLVAPRCMVFDRSHTSTIYLTGSYSAIYKFNLFTKVMELLAGGINQHGLVDGLLSQSKLSYPREIAQVTDRVFAVATHNAVQLLNTQTEMMWTYCIGEPLISQGLAETPCNLTTPRSAVVINDTLLIGGDNDIIEIPVNIPHNLEETECNTTITHTLPVGELTAILRITSDYTAELTEGDYIYVRGDYCTIRIHVLQDGKSKISSTSASCPQNSTSSHMPEAGNGSLTAELRPGKFLQSAVEGTVRYTDTNLNCTKNINITKAAVPVKMIEKPSCPDNITEVASRESLRSNIEISVSGLTQSIELPIGTHSYYLSYDGISCPLSINVIDPHVRRRVYLESNYQVNCSHLEIPVNNQILRETVELHKSQITEICEQECQTASDTEPITTCSDDELTVRWPTDLIYGGYTRDIPTVTLTVISNNLKRKGSAFSLVIVGHHPPVMYPVERVDGSTAHVILMSYCDIPGLVHDPKLDQCV